MEAGDKRGKMKTISTIAEYRAWRKSLKLESGELVGFFPTMGALHMGHMDLAKAAKAKCKVVVSSIFVNPAQFAPHEDFGSYPRQQEEDLAKLEAEGVDMVFLPTKDMMYPDGFDTYVESAVGSERNEGAVRPHFFKGVATVCCKLFNIVQPDAVFFGQKDAQQCVVIEHLLRDLNMDMELVIVPTHREADGLAMSSRNQYLEKEERAKASLIFKALSAGKELVEEKQERSTQAVIDAISKVLASDASFQVQYVQVLHRSTLLALDKIEAGQEVLVAVAAMLGKTRLIDNFILKSPP